MISNFINYDVHRLRGIEFHNGNHDPFIHRKVSHRAYESLSGKSAGTYMYKLPFFVLLTSRRVLQAEEIVFSPDD